MDTVLKKEKNENFFLWSEFRIYFLNNFLYISYVCYSSVSYRDHVVNNIPSTYLSYNWRLGTTSLSSGTVLNHWCY